MSQRSRPSKRFKPTRWTEQLVPLLLILLTLLLFGTILFLFLALVGLIP